MAIKDKGQTLALALGQAYLKGRYDYLTNHRVEMESGIEQELYDLGRRHERLGLKLPENVTPSPFSIVFE